MIAEPWKELKLVVIWEESLDNLICRVLVLIKVQSTG